MKSVLLACYFVFLSNVYVEAKQLELNPGEIFYIDFPDLGPSHHSEQTRAGIYLPTDYNPNRKFPLLVWFGGGPGNDSPGIAKEITNNRGFICVALPYKKNLNWKTPWSVYHTMLREVERAVPNIHPQQRACSGFSSGGAAICFSLSEKDPGFLSYFRGFMPGGAGWVMGNIPPLKNKLIYAYIGSEDTRVQGFDTIAPAFKTAGADVTYNKYNAGHTLPKEIMPAMRKWLIDKMVLADLPPLMNTMRSSVAKKEFGQAYAMARQITEITEIDMLEHNEAKAIMERMLPLGKELAEATLNAPLATQQRFALNWKGCSFAIPIEEKCKESAESQLKRILSMKPISAEYLKKYMIMWNGFPYANEGIVHYDQLAATAIEEIRIIPSKANKNFALQKFITTWDPAPTVNEARAMRETMAKEELDSIRSIPAKGTMKGRLREFIGQYKDTNAEQDAITLLNN